MDFWVYLKLSIDAVLGLQELCTTHPATLGASLGIVLNGILKLFVDDDREVRRALLSFLQQAIPAVDKVNLQPFLPLLIMYTCSAMSHIFEDVRLDAVKLMDLWVDVAPETVVDKFWDKIVGIYTSILTVNSVSASSSNIGGTKVTNVGSAKVAAAKSHLQLHKVMWFLLGSLNSKRAKDGFRKQLARLKSPRDSNVMYFTAEKAVSCYLAHPATESTITYLSQSYLPNLNLFESSGPKNERIKDTDVTGVSKAAGTSSKTDNFSVRELVQTFQTVLVSSWLETAPSVFSSTNSIILSPALQLLQVVLKLTLILWRALVSSDEIYLVESAWLEKYCYQLLKHFALYFPYGADALGDGGAKADAVLREMNIATCELTSLLLLAKSVHSQPSTGQKRRYDEMEAVNAEWTDKIVDHVLGILGSQDTNNGKMTTMSVNFKESDLSTLLPAVWGFMNSLDARSQYEIFKVI
ncbi:Rix1 complex component [Fennellomyces sp. T-0311]|nr:Rix1 complex component [Fennellomyces sp. T-0311]